VQGAAMLTAMGILSLAGGCARQPPEQNQLSGKRLVVTMQFRSAVNPLYHYYFIINNAGNQNAPGPIPVFQPANGQSYGNGFATGSSGGTTGFTDFVLYDSSQPNGYGLYHVIGDPNKSQFVYGGKPINFVVPDPNNVQTANLLQFEIDLSQIITDANGQPLPSDQAANMARALRFLQVNIVSTNIVPRDSFTIVDKRVDSFGDTRISSVGNTSFLILDLSQLRVVSSQDQDIMSSQVAEPTFEDVWPRDDDSLDLISWSIEVRQL
jgi:hypothetical protein